MISRLQPGHGGQGDGRQKSKDGGAPAGPSRFNITIPCELNILPPGRPKSTLSVTHYNRPAAAPRAAKTCRLRPGVGFRLPQDLFLREAAGHLARRRPGRPPARRSAALPPARPGFGLRPPGFGAGGRLPAASCRRRLEVELQLRPAGPASRPATRETVLTRRTGSTLACGLNLMTTSSPSRSIVSMPSRSAMMRIRPYSARFSTEVGGAP